jgi:hypothetical protein
MMHDKFFEPNESQISKIRSMKPFEDYEEDKIVDNFIDINKINEEGVEEETKVDEEESDIEEEEGEFGKEVDGKSHGEDAFWDSLKPTYRELRNLQTIYNHDPLMFTDCKDLSETALSNQICGNFKVLLQFSVYDGSSTILIH